VAVDADVGDPAARADQVGAELEGLGDAHRLDGHVGAEPSLRPMTTSAGSSASLLTVTSAPNWVRAFSRRESALSIATTFLGPYSRAVIIAASPTGPAPTTATTSPGRTLPFWTPTSNPVGRMSDRNSTCSSLSPSGTW